MSSQTFINFKIWLIGLLGSILLRSVNLTLRWERVGLDGDKQWWADDKASILMFWHSRILFMPWIYLHHRKSTKSPRLVALISQHNDGRMIAAGMNFLDIDSIAGSSSRGGLRSLHLLIEQLRNNNHIAITPDGPKGPSQKLKSGVIHIAQKSGAVIHPAAFASEHYWQFKSWDRMIFPKPFSRAVFIKGEPIKIEQTHSQAELDLMAEKIENQLNLITQQADQYFKK